MSKDFTIKYSKNILVAILTILFSTSILLLNNRLQNNITIMHVDEIHTINLGVHSMYSGEVAGQTGVLTVIVGESTRWLARIIYPAALYYMNSKMGGDIASKGIKHSSGYYIEQKLYDTYSINKDPNIQDFVFAMKFTLGTVVLISFFIASYLMIISYGTIAGFLYFSFATSTLLINDMLLIFYTESTMIILFNSILILALNNNSNKLRLYLWSALALAFSISTKLTGIVYSLPIIAILLTKDSDSFKSLRIEGFILLTIVLVYLIHIFSWGQLMEVLDQTLVNVYHYKTGHGGHTIPSGMVQFKAILQTLTPWIFLFPIALLFLLRNKFAHKKFVLSVAISGLLMIISLVDVHFFVKRNLTTPLVMILFIIAIALSLLVACNKYKTKPVKIFSFIIILIYAGLSFNKNYIPINEQEISKYTTDCKNIALIDVQKRFFNNPTIINSMPAAFSLKKILPELREELSKFECVVVNRTKNNKQYTNYILPMDFDSSKRLGNYFFYYQSAEKIKNMDKIKDLRKNIGKLNHESLLISSKFNVYLESNKLIFYKLACYDKHIKDRFSIHTKPSNTKTSSKNISKHNKHTVDFNASTSNNVIAGTCFFEIPLPLHDYSNITIKQYKNETIVWEENINIEKK